MKALLLLLLVAGCTDPITRGPDGPGTDSDEDTDVDPDTDDTDAVQGPTGFIGSPCDSDVECDFDGGFCQPDVDGYPDGMCTAPCDKFCDDADGHPTTYCVDGQQVPSRPSGWDGACFSRCDFGVFPDGGCRDDYGCVVADRANDPAQNYVCMPNAESDLTECHQELADRGVAFELAIVPPRAPDSHPDLTCSIADPVRILGEIHGVEIQYVESDTPSRLLTACNMALALTDTIDDVRTDGVIRLWHYGTYNCRVIAGTNSLSRHAYGDAIDIYGFDFSNGTTYTLIDDWEHDTTSPNTAGGRFLREAAYRWYDEKYWNIILTPNYDAAHDNHFHVDLTPGSDTIRFTDGRYIGPALYAD